MAPPQPGYGTTAKRKRSSASLTETKQDLRPEQDHSRSGSAPSTSWAECRDKKGSAPSRRKEMSLDIPLYRTCPNARSGNPGVFCRALGARDCGLLLLVIAATLAYRRQHVVLGGDGAVVGRTVLVEESVVLGTRIGTYV